jgi:hypothetical protein
VLVPNDQGKHRLGYVLAHLIELVNTDGSLQPIPAPATSRAARPIAQGAAIPPTPTRLPLQRDKATERVIAVSVVAPAFGQQGKPSLYITPTADGFDVYLAAAMVKKGVPVTVLDHEDGSTYTLNAAQIETKQVGGGTKLVNCLFLYCAGNEDKGNTSVQLVQAGTIKWSYSVNKGRGEKNRQSMAEAIAKHLKSEFFHE